jgi:cytochrome c5
MRDLAIRAALLAGCVAATGPAIAQRPPAAAFEPAAEDPAAFPDVPGRDEAFGFCAACHAFRLVAAQGMTREQWDASLTWMTDRHAMPELDAADRGVILDYLARAFPPRAPAAGRAGWRNPFLPQ